MSLRSEAVRVSITRIPRKINLPTSSFGKALHISEFFGSHTLGLDQLKEKLPKDTFEALNAMVHKGVRLSKPAADEIANVVKDWALEKGTTHFCHWFQPMTGLTAEKHDSFISTRVSETGQTQAMDRFTGSALI